MVCADACVHATHLIPQCGAIHDDATVLGLKRLPVNLPTIARHTRRTRCIVGLVEKSSEMPLPDQRLRDLGRRQPERGQRTGEEQKGYSPAPSLRHLGLRAPGPPLLRPDRERRQRCSSRVAKCQLGRLQENIRPSLARRTRNLVVQLLQRRRQAADALCDQTWRRSSIAGGRARRRRVPFAVGARFGEQVQKVRVFNLQQLVLSLQFVYEPLQFLVRGRGVHANPDAAGRRICVCSFSAHQSSLQSRHAQQADSARAGSAQCHSKFRRCFQCLLNKENAAVDRAAGKNDQPLALSLL